MEETVKKDYVNPPTLLEPPGFTQVLVVEGASKIVFVSGQVAIDQAGKLIGAGDLKAQIRQAAKNLKAALIAVNATPADIVKINTYIVNYQQSDYSAMREARAELFADDARFPASTMVGVTSLAVDGLLVEMEAIAILQ
jgi:enamine deaminase RidA (YjgF/YER057c/UK114 family)